MHSPAVRKCVEDGPTHEIINAYLSSEIATSALREWGSSEAPGDNVVRLRAVRARRFDGTTSEAFDIRQPIGIDVMFDVLEDGKDLTPNIHVFDRQGVNIFISHDIDPNWRQRSRPVGRYISTVWIPGNFLAEGTFIVGAAITTMVPINVRLYARDAVAFQVIDSTDGDTARGDYAGSLPGIVRPMLRWETSYEASQIGAEKIVR